MKRAIARTIAKTIRELKPPGRFIKFDSKSGAWHELSENQTVEKILQALRESHST